MSGLLGESPALLETSSMGEKKEQTYASWLAMNPPRPPKPDASTPRDKLLNQIQVDEIRSRVVIRFSLAIEQ